MSNKAAPVVVFAGGGGMGIGTILTIIFVILKLTNTIAWSWLWVLSPLMVTGGLWVLAFVFVLLALIASRL
jgi:hypothetical protein